MINYQLKKEIKIEEIDLDSNEYCLEYPSINALDQSIKESLNRYNVIYPPILLKSKSNYKVVLGKRHINAIKERHAHISCCLIIEDSINDLNLFRFLLSLKKVINGFNTVEKAIAIKRLSGLDKNMDRKLVSIIGIPYNREIINGFLQLAESSDYIKNLIFDRKIEESTAFEVFRFDRNNWDILTGFIVKIALGTKKRNQILNMIYILTEGDKSKIIDMIECKEIISIIHEDIDPPQKSNKIYRYFESLRYPFIYQFKENFNKKLKKSGIKKDFDLVIPENFEKWEFKVQFKVSSLEDFKENIKKLKELSEKDEFKNLIESRY